MKLQFQSNMNRHLGKLSNILRLPSNRKLEHKIQRNPRSFLTSISCLYRQSLSLIKREKEVRMMRMKIDKVRRKAERLMHTYSYHKIGQKDFDETVDVVDSETSEVIVTQDDLDGEQQLEGLENLESMEFEKSCFVEMKTNHDTCIRREQPSSDPIDLSFSSFTNQTKPFTSPSPPSKLQPDCSTSLPTFESIRSNAFVTSAPIINNLPTRRSADDHLEQFMLVDPNQNIKWKQLADKFNKELGPNICGVCHKTLSCKSALTMHYRVHTEERPFVCKVCEKRFSTKGNLKTHLGQHADVTDQYCVNSGALKPGNLMVPSSTMPHTTAIDDVHKRLSFQSHGFPFPLPGLATNPQFLFHMFSQNNNADLNIIDSLKMSQKFSNPDGVKKSDETLPKYGCNFCRQIFPTKVHLEIHLQSHCCKKDFINVNTNGKFANNQPQKLDGDSETISNAGESDQSSEHKNVSDKFSLSNLMALHNPPVNIFSMMNNPSLLNRAMMPPFPGFGPPLCYPNATWAPRISLSANIHRNKFSYNYSEIDNK